MDEITDHPTDDPLVALAERGQLRPALDPPAALRSIKRKRSLRASAEILADVRGGW